MDFDPLVAVPYDEQAHSMIHDTQLRIGVIGLGARGYLWKY